ncbi:hypothetical protein FI667_g12940, partial [Globisporangium splendens]
MEAAKRQRNDTLPRVDASKSLKRTAAAAAAADSAGACPAKRVADEASFLPRTDRVCGPAVPVAPQPQENDGEPICGDVDVEELLLIALEDELEPHKKNAGGAVGASISAMPQPSTLWLPIVEEDDNYDESDDED